MPYSVRLDDLRTAVQIHSDTLNSQRYTTANYNSLINKKLNKFYNRVNCQSPGAYQEKTQAYTSVASTTKYNLPTDFFRCINITQLMANTRNVSLHSFSLKERHVYERRAVVAGQAVTMLYIPTFTALSNDSDTFDFVLPGWEDLVVYETAADILDSERMFEQAQVLRLRAKDIEEDVQEWIQRIDLGGSFKIVDTNVTLVHPVDQLYFDHQQFVYRIGGKDSTFTSGYLELLMRY